MSSLLVGADVDAALEADEAWLEIPYDIVTVIARDDEGAVYLARPIGTANHVVLKIMHTSANSRRLRIGGVTNRAAGRRASES